MFEVGVAGKLWDENRGGFLAAITMVTQRAETDMAVGGAGDTRALVVTSGGVAHALAALRHTNTRLTFTSAVQL